jgi:hypothetical protein
MASHPKTTIFVVILTRSCHIDNRLFAHPHMFLSSVFHILMLLINVHRPG